MPRYKITFSRSARRELQTLPKETAERILAQIETLASHPRPHECKKLKGQTNLWRLRIGEYRVVYSVDDRNQAIDIAIVRHRSEAYR